ncbi:uncharacterized protein KGF55_004751 [Candida pseudojiufengensis]|uniref:uncharacterized protein n=1 Tax=Candida pseudojiufengensis TaxID=497109 RepID=UPI0022257B69|nr:uncharacterized protein KGF55_004751 [Candida pseudojiufengensis]KAI5960458.1 hypothetical protein KGF55_004751 [Candida pseudojiufengensis]
MDDSQHALIIKNNDNIQNEIGDLIQELTSVAIGETSNDERDLVYQKLTTKLVQLINQYELQPKLLEKKLGIYIQSLSSKFLQDDELMNSIGQIIYAFSKICSFKTTSLYFSSDVYLIEVLLTKCENNTNEFVKFSCLLWLCNLVLVPFPISSIKNDLPQRLKEVGEFNLFQYTNGSKIQKIASIMLAGLLSRSDSEEMLNNFLLSLEENWVDQISNKRLGNLLVINQILKRKLVNLDVIYKCMVHDILESNCSNLTLYYSIKILSKLAVNYCQQHDFAKTCQIINLLLNEILTIESIPFDINLRYSMAKALAAIIDQLSYVAINYQSQLIEYVLLLLSQCDLTIYNISKIQTLLLILGYVALRKKIQVEYCETTLKLASKFLFFKIQNGIVTLGNQVRDSSTFVIWSIVKNMKHYKPIVRDVFLDLLKVLVFDEELILKKCSVAVLQEIIGRFGTELIQIKDLESKGEFIINFVEKLGRLHLNSKISYQFFDEYYEVFDLSFLVDPLLTLLCDQDGEGKYLNKLLIQPAQLELAPRCIVNFDDIRSRLEKSNRWHILFELDQFSDAGDEIFVDFQYNESKKDMIKGYLMYLSRQQLNEVQWQNVIKIIKYHDYTEQFRFIISNQIQIPMSEILHHLPHSEVLSKSLFYFRHLNIAQYDELIRVIKNPGINATIRANLIENLSFNLPSFFNISTLYDLFDDYTTTDQGDVGSKIRMNMIKLVRQNKIMDKTIQLKLVRLSGEIMDKLRNHAFKSLTNKSFSWCMLFDYYQTLNDFNMKLEFWKGVVFTTGSLVGNSKLINESFNELIKYKPTSVDLKILLSFIQPIVPKKTSTRERKLILSTLQLILKLFDSNYKFIGMIDFNELFKKCYNVHINTKDLNRIKIVLQIFNRIVEDCPNLKRKIYDRYLWILKNHQLKEVKVFVGEVILFDVVVSMDDSEIFDNYSKIDWFDISKSDLNFVEMLLQ